VNKTRWIALVGAVITIASLVYVFRSFDWTDARQRLADANYGLLFLSTALATTIYPLRARRWRTILDPVAPKIPMGPLWRSVAIGQMLNNVVPSGRAGEPGRAYALTRDVPSVPFATAFASLIVDRAFDAIVIVLLTGISLVGPGAPTHTGANTAKAMIGFAALAGGMLVTLFLLALFPERLIRIFEMFARPVSKTIEQKGAEILRKFAHGFSVLRSPVHFAAILGWALALWLVQALAFWIGFKAVGIEVPFAAALLVQGAIVIFVSVPAAPGYFGLFEMGAAASLPLYGVSETAATTWAVLFHVASFIPITLFGAYYFAKLGLSLRDITTTSGPGNNAAPAPSP
jgi:uncharacterized protein (TIRG00374 family)